MQDMQWSTSCDYSIAHLIIIFQSSSVIFKGAVLLFTHIEKLY